LPPQAVSSAYTLWQRQEQGFKKKKVNEKERKENHIRTEVLSDIT